MQNCNCAPRSDNGGRAERRAWRCQGRDTIRLRRKRQEGRFRFLPIEVLLVNGTSGRSSAEASFWVFFSPHRFGCTERHRSEPAGPAPRPSPACYFGEHLKVCRRAAFERTRLLTHADSCEAEHADGSSTSVGSREVGNSWNLKAAGKRSGLQRSELRESGRGSTPPGSRGSHGGHGVLPLGAGRTQTAELRFQR